MRLKYLIIASLLHFILIAFLNANNKDNRPLPYITSKIKIDGFISKDEWKEATQIREFYTYYPTAGALSDEKTVAFFGRDAKNLYVAFICFYDDPSQIRANITPRDAIFKDDYVIFYLDTYNTGEHAYQFGFNPYGIQADGIFTEYVGEDFRPDYQLTSKGRLFSKGYIVEAKIPFNNFNIPNKETMNWKIGILRNTANNKHGSIWPKVSINRNDIIGQFTHFTNISDLEIEKKVELIPEFTGSRIDTYNKNKKGLNEAPILGHLGLNIKYTLSSNLNMELTYKPDFSQVEADPERIEVNRLNSIYYSEKRTFFLEGKEIYKTPIQAIHTRQLAQPFIGLKLNGKVGNYSMSYFGVLDDHLGSNDYLEQHASARGFSQTFQDSLKQTHGGKRSINHLFRIKRNIFKTSNLGIIYTGRNFEDSFNHVYGLDGRLQFSGQNIFTFQGLQTQTRHIFSAQTLKDFGIYSQFLHSSELFNMQLNYSHYGKNFKMENGFFEEERFLKNDLNTAGGDFWIDFRNDKATFQHFRPYVSLRKKYDADYNRIEDYIYSSLFFQTDFNTNFDLGHYYKIFNSQGDDLHLNYYFFSVTNTSIKTLRFYLSTLIGDALSEYVTDHYYVGFTNYTTASITYKPTPSINLYARYIHYRFTGGINGVNGAVTNQIPRFKLKYQFNRNFSMRLISEYSRLMYDNKSYKKDNLNLSLLFSYAPSPGTLLFLGYGNVHDKYGRSDFTKLTEVERGVFFKLSYRFANAF